MSVTDKVKKLRVEAKGSNLKTGQWYSNFSTAKKYAINNNLPFFAVWSNGDLCGHCTTFETCILDSTFKTWMKDSGVVFWIGLGTDKTTEDKMNGTGYNWTWGSKKALKLFPFVRLYWKPGKVDVCKTGDEWDGASSKGAATLVKKLKSYLKNYDKSCPSGNCEPEDTQPETPETSENECDNGECTPPMTLSYEKNESGTFKLVSNRDLSNLTEAEAKNVVDKFNK